MSVLTRASGYPTRTAALLSRARARETRPMSFLRLPLNKSTGAHLMVHMCSEGYSSCRVCLSVCVSVKSHLTSGVSVCRENAAMYSAGNEGQKFVAFSLKLSFQSYGTSCIVRLPCSRPFSHCGICMCVSNDCGGGSDVHNVMLRFIHDCHQLSCSSIIQRTS